ncbi:MAG: inorganic diphosphatase [Deltaproteobacteria bacterium]|nr:inorganic diphosphatase [Deltaproteobacteria bacterium]
MKLGKHWVAHVELSDKPDEWVSVVNEIPADSSCKYRLDKTTGQLSLARVLPRSITYPTSYGFIPHTRSKADDEETDVMIVTSEPVLPLTIARARIIGGFAETSSDLGVPDDRMIAVVENDPNTAELKDVDDLEAALRTRIERFVVEYKQNEDIQVTFDGWFDRAEALERLRKAFKLGKKRAAK